MISTRPPGIDRDMGCRPTTGEELVDWARRMESLHQLRVTDYLREWCVSQEFPPHLTRLAPEQVLQAYREACYKVRTYTLPRKFLPPVTVGDAPASVSRCPQRANISCVPYYHGENPLLDQVPRNIDKLLEWIGLMEAVYPVQLLWHLVFWAQCRKLPGRMKDWDADQVARAHVECLRRLAEPPREPGCDDEPDPRT